MAKLTSWRVSATPSSKAIIGGTGIGIYKDWLYAETNDRIVRYALPKDGIVPQGAPETVVSGLPLTGDHPMHPLAIDKNGNLFIDVASATNSCQPQNRMPNVPGDKPCTELETRAGIWRYDANKTGQKFSPAERYATGIRNADGITIDATGLGLWATQQGRDELYENWPKLYNKDQGANLPAEELLQVKQGDDLAGLNAISTMSSRSWCSRRNMAASAARRLACAPRRRDPSPSSPPIGRRTTSCSTTGRNSRPLTKTARSSPFTARGTARPCRKAVTMWCSSRSQAVNRRGSM